MKPILPFLLFLFYLSTVSSQVVQLPYIKINGFNNGSNVERFLGIPYNHPGSFKRFTVGIPIDESKIPAGSTFNATVAGKICPQSKGDGIAEDCLNLDIARPTGTSSGSKLPVMVWIYGGGFVDGDVGIYDPVSTLNYTTGLGLPFVFVAMNYRLNGFGFLPGKEAMKEGVLNLGLKDQRLALKWVQKYISYFGGDPEKVTIFGESAGGISVSLHLIAYGATKETDLFRAAIAQSGSVNTLIVPDSSYLQSAYDLLVNQTNCNGTSDTLECLRQVDYDTISPFIFSAKTPTILSGPFAPCLDGDLIPDVPHRLIEQGKFVRVPLIAGEVLDEGTLFTFTVNWYSEELARYGVSLFYPKLGSGSIDQIFTLYQNNLTIGSPYNTGTRSYYGVQGKRVASIFGDFYFTHPRRWQSEHISSHGVPTWNYRFDYNYFLGNIDSPYYTGVAHSIDFYSLFQKLGRDPSSKAMGAYWSAFATNLDPNIGTSGFANWKQFNNGTRELLVFEQTAPAMRLDDYRREQSDFYNTILEELYGFPTPPPVTSTSSFTTTSTSSKSMTSTDASTISVPSIKSSVSFPSSTQRVLPMILLFALLLLTV